LNFVLVTGASGFVGRAVCERALALGLKVRGSHRSLNSQVLIPVGVEKILMASIEGDTDWSNALAGVDTVIHLAGRAHILQHPRPDDLAIYRKVNTFATERLARMAAAVGVRRFIYISTIKVNGEKTTTAPFTELDLPRPQDAYAVSKWESEEILGKIGAETGLEIIILRPPLVYGGGVRANFERLIRLVERRIPLPLLSVTNRRSLIFVKNLADAILLSASHPNVARQTFFLSDGEDISTPELIRLIADAMHIPTRMFRCPSSLLSVGAGIIGKKTEVNRLFDSLAVDSRRFNSATAWVPPYTLSEGIKETIERYLDNKSMPVEGISRAGRLAGPLDSSSQR
jgi:nucleoside-diphosphate-sugar epimerase